jgi:hypothetical protein
MNANPTTNPYSITLPFLYAVAADDEPLDLAIPARKNTKRTGELGEAAFLHQAAGRGYKILRPWGDSERYDFVIDACAGFRRIQVKCTESLNARGYQVQSTFCDRRRKGKLTRHDIDFLAAYIIPLDLWYIVPVQAFPASASLRFYPDLHDASNSTRDARQPAAPSSKKINAATRNNSPSRTSRRSQASSPGAPSFLRPVRKDERSPGAPSFPRSVRNDGKSHSNNTTSRHRKKTYPRRRARLESYREAWHLLKE